MGLIEDVKKFLELRLEDLIKQNPWIELHILDEKLEQQEVEVNKLVLSFADQEAQFQKQILALAEDVSLWHRRAQKATAANRSDLAQAAKEREASLLKEGNQLWAQMELVKQRSVQAQELLQQIKKRRQEVRQKLEQVEQNKKTKTETPHRFDWQNLRTPDRDEDDPLEQQFRRWELDEELEQLKRRMK